MMENNDTPRTNEIASIRRTTSEWKDHSEGLERDLNTTTSELAALKARLAAVEWQTIENAPKDGRWILAWSPNDEAHDKLRFIDKAHKPDSGWYDTYGEMCMPTHWMPLPPAPAGKGRAE